MNINWNPTYSPVWKWLRNHAMAALALAISNPDLVQTMAGHYAPVVNSILGAVASLGFVAGQYAPAPPAAAPAASSPAAAPKN